MLVVTVSSTESVVATTAELRALMGTTSTADDARQLASLKAATRWAEGYIGFPLFVHTGVATTHQKTTWVSHNSYAQAVGDDWRQDVPDEDVKVVEFDLLTEQRPNRAERRRRSRAG